MKKRFIAGIFLSIILTLITFIYDAPIIKFISGLRNIFLDYVFMSVGFAANAFIIFFFLTSLFLWQEHKRRWILPLWMASFFSALISFVFKILVGRARPFQEGLVSALGVALYFIKDSFTIWNFSFPSFEAMLVFSALPILSKEFKKFKYVWFIFACLVALSRAYFGVHYLSDVLTGATIGYLIGTFMVFIEEKNKLGLKLIQKIKIVGKKLKFLD